MLQLTWDQGCRPQAHTSSMSEIDLDFSMLFFFSIDLLREAVRLRAEPAYGFCLGN